MMLRTATIVITFAMVMGSAACKGKGDGKSPIVPKRVESKGEADATAAFGTVKEGENPKLVLGLPDRNAGQEPAVDAAVVDSCVDFLGSDFEVGEAKCADSKKVVKLTAGMFKQTCFLQDSETRAATQTLKVDCEEAQLFLYTFDPPLRAEIE